MGKYTGFTGVLGHCGQLRFRREPLRAARFDRHAPPSSTQRYTDRDTILVERTIMQRKNAWKDYSAEDLTELESFAAEYKNFISLFKTER